LWAQILIVYGSFTTGTKTFFSCGQIRPDRDGHFGPVKGGQFKPDSGGQLHRIFHKYHFYLNNYANFWVTYILNPVILPNLKVRLINEVPHLINKVSCSISR